MSAFKRLHILVILVLFSGAAAYSQVHVQGTVYERTGRVGVVGVSVRSTSGAGTVTDSAGHYSLRLPYADSIYFSYLGKATQKFAISEIPWKYAFDIKMHMDIHVLPTVEVRERSYHLDSITTREEYRKVFDFSPDYITSGNGGAGVNLDALFSMGKIKQMRVFQRRLEAYEQEKYVTHRFNRSLVERITGLKSPDLERFMLDYRPSFEMLMSFENDYEYYQYILNASRYFKDDLKRGRRYW
jgi:hypothetical protein